MKLRLKIIFIPKDCTFSFFFFEVTISSTPDWFGFCSEVKQEQLMAVRVDPPAEEFHYLIIRTTMVYF